MAFPGLKDPKQIDDIVAYLKQLAQRIRRRGLSLLEESSRRRRSGAVGEIGSAAFRRLPDKSVLQPVVF